MQILANTHSHNLLLFEHILEAGSADLEIEKLTEENVSVSMGISICQLCTARWPLTLSTIAKQFYNVRW